MKYEVTFVPKSGAPECRDTLTFGDRDAVSVAKTVFKMAMTGYYSDVEVRRTRGELEPPTAIIPIEVEALDGCAQTCPFFEIEAVQLYGDGEIVNRFFRCKNVILCRGARRAEGGQNND